MKFNGGLFILFLFIQYTGLTQDSVNYQWQLHKTFPLEKDHQWTVDALSNMYISHHSVIDKYDSLGNLKFSQSIKSLGEMKQMLPINSMKMVHFSEEQQTLCFFDNTLTQNGDCKELIESGVFNASYISVSERSDKLWVYDNVNSNLKLIDLEGKVAQEIELTNIKGVLGIESIVEVKEKFNRLFILDAHKGVFVFDIYGSFIDRYEIVGGKDLDANDQSIFVLQDNNLTVIALDRSYEMLIPLPDDDIIEFSLINQTFFLRSPQNVYKYTLQF